MGSVFGSWIPPPPQQKPEAYGLNLLQFKTLSIGLTEPLPPFACAKAISKLFWAFRQALYSANLTASYDLGAL